MKESGPGRYGKLPIKTITEANRYSKYMDKKGNIKSSKSIKRNSRGH